MNITLVPEDGTGMSTANTLCTLVEATAILLNDPQATDWIGSEDDEKRKAALVRSMELMREHLRWNGETLNSTQRAPLPRTGLFDRNGYEVLSTAVPEDGKRAQAYLALLLFRDDRISESGDGIEAAVRMGQTSVTYGSGGSGVELIPDWVRAPIRPFLDESIHVWRA